jgi:hypothetical protein
MQRAPDFSRTTLGVELDGDVEGVGVDFLDGTVGDG